MTNIIVRPKRDTLEKWNASEYIPKLSEIIVIHESFNTENMKEPKFKIGDGIHTVIDLPYVSMDFAFRNGYVYPDNRYIESIKIDLYNEL